MTRSSLIVIASLVAILAFGLFGRFSIAGAGVVDIGLVAVWLFAWLGERPLALGFAVALGLVYDLISFFPFGYWLIVFSLLVMGIDYLKSRFLTVSSFWQALAVLAIATLLYQLSASIWAGAVNYWPILVSLLLNALIGAILYYLLVFRLRLFQRWTGRRL